MRGKGIGELQIADSQIPRVHMLFRKRDHVSEYTRGRWGFTNLPVPSFFRAEKWPYRYYMVSLLYWDCETRGISMAPSISMQQPAGIDFYNEAPARITRCKCLFRLQIPVKRPSKDRQSLR
jgi:hypothetical protein